jgi:MFS family permease
MSTVHEAGSTGAVAAINAGCQEAMARAKAAVTASGTASASAARSRTGRRTLSPVAAFVGAALAFVGVTFAAGAPSPLFVLYQQEWGFPAWVLTIAFAIYAITLLVTLLIAGSLSDHIGRRPVLLGALALEVVSMLIFLFAQDIGWIIVARAIQGVATGAATGTFTAAIVELAPAKHKKLGAVIGSTAPVGGLALGALITGAAVQFTAVPTVIVFSFLAVFFTLGIVVVALSAETVSRRAGAVRSLIPRLSIPRAARAEFAAIVPVLIGTWMLAGLFLGLAPSIIRGVFHIDSGLVNGAIVALQPAAGAVTGFLLGRVNARTATIGGAASVVVGVVISVSAIAFGMLPLLFVGGVLGGAGFGAAFSGALRILAPLAPTHQRAELFAGVYLVNYLAYGVPALIVGELIGVVGLLDAVIGYGIAVALATTVGLVVQVRRAYTLRSARPATGAVPAVAAAE